MTSPTLLGSLEVTPGMDSTTLNNCAISASVAASPPPPADMCTTPTPFRLLDLPDELKLAVVAFVDERDPSPTFPSGPSTELLALSATSRWFHAVCRPLIWRSLRFVPDNVLRPVHYRRKRDMRALRHLVETRARQGAPLPIVALSVADLSADNEDLYDEGAVDELPDEEKACVQVIQHLARSSLQVLFLKGMELHRDLGEAILRAIAASPKLSALRFNQVDFFPFEPHVVHEFGPLPHVKTLQIMHSDPEIVRLLPPPPRNCPQLTHADDPRTQSGLVSKCPNVDSLLLWPSLRRVGRHMDAVKGLLPHLRNLSLDSVREAHAFRVIADEIIVRCPLLSVPRCVCRAGD